MHPLLRILAILCLFASPVLAQYTPPTGGVDTYQGLNNAPCTHGTATAFSLAQVGNNTFFCDFSGHVYIWRGFYNFDPTIVGSTDEANHTYQFYVTAKYGTNQNWADKSILDIGNFGWNGIGPFHSTSVAQPWQTANPRPFVASSDIVGYSVKNNNLHGSSCQPKSLMFLLKLTTWPGQKTAYLPDFNSTCWGVYYSAFLANDLAFGVGSQSAAMKHYLIGVADCDSDNCHCLGAGPDFTALNGNNDFRCGMMTFYLPPTTFSDGTGGTQRVYADGQVDIKRSAHDILKAKYGTISAMNSTWSSSYTTFETSGTCYGANQPASTCPSPNAAISLGTGNGSTLTFSGTLPTGTSGLSLFSVYVAVAGANAGGDQGNGTIYGLTIGSATVNYSTGAVSVTFSAGNAPAIGAAVTVGGITDGWGIGTGFMDEDCRTAHSSYCGAHTNAAVTLFTGVPSGVQTDMGLITKAFAQAYASQAVTAIAGWGTATGFTGHILHLGIYTLGSWGVPPDRDVLRGLFAGGQDVIIMNGSGGTFSTMTQPMLNFIDTYWPGAPIVMSSYRVANLDSPFNWPNTTITRTNPGTGATATLALPSNFSAGQLVDIQGCADSTMNRLQIHPNATNNSTGVMTYTTTGSSTVSNTCSFQYSDNNEGGYASQALRGANYLTNVGSSLAATYAGSGKHPYLGQLMWSYYDQYNELLNWGWVTLHDNKYDGVSGCGNGNCLGGANTRACPAPLGLLTCGGEAANHMSNGIFGDFADPVGLAHTQQDTYVLSLFSSSSPGTITGIGTVGGTVTIKVNP